MEKRDKKYHFICYGTDSYRQYDLDLFANLDRSFFDEKGLYNEYNIKYIPEFEEKLEDQTFCSVFNSQTGAGYWIWKPFIVYDYLKRPTVNYGDLVIYSDLKFKPDPNAKVSQFESLHQKVKSTSHDILLPRFTDEHEFNCINKDHGSEFKIKTLNKFYTHPGSYKFFNIKDKAAFEEKFQIWSVVYGIVKSEKSLAFFKKFRDIAASHPTIFTNNFDDFSIELSELKNFVSNLPDHYTVNGQTDIESLKNRILHNLTSSIQYKLSRNDQSVLNLLCEQEGLQAEDLNDHSNRYSCGGSGIQCESSKPHLAIPNLFDGIVKSSGYSK